MIRVYTDGSCRNNGKKDASGGFGIVVTQDDKIIRLYQKFSTNTTNNREELKAIMWAAIHYPDAIIYSDSNYAIKTLSVWMFYWERNGWIKTNGQLPENLDIIKPYFDFIKRKKYNINIEYVKGHNGHEYNELADDLATGRKQVGKNGTDY